MPSRRKLEANRHQRVTASELTQLLQPMQQPVSWRELVAMVGAQTPQEIKQLRLLLKGMVRNDELLRDHQGNYQLAAPGDTHEGRLVARGRQLFADGYPLAEARHMALRADDLVVYQVFDGSARVLELLEPSGAPVVGVLRWSGRHPYVEPLGSSFRGRVSLLEAPLQGGDGDMVEVRIVEQGRRGLVGLVERIIEGERVLDHAIASTIAAARIPNAWDDAVLRATDRLPKRVHPARHDNRMDLTALPLVTIDGETAKDFDDAVFAEPVGSAGWRLVVAIADVAHYVKAGSALDAAAQERGTSVYFPHYVVRRLPAAISNDLCSLRPQVPRLALVCDMRVSTQGEVGDAEFYEAVIFSHARLTYTQVQRFLDTGASPSEQMQDAPAVTTSLSMLHEVFQVLSAQRANRGALDFGSREAQLDIVDGRIHRIDAVQRLTAHQLIEEAMIAANVCAARYLEAHDRPSLYRVHQPPESLKYEELRQALALAGITLPKGVPDGIRLRQALALLQSRPQSWLYEQMVLRTMQQAIYTPHNEGHFGLGLERYMHFTSPIRRYPDLLVHRAIKSVLQSKTRNLPGLDDLVSLGEQCSHTERRAESAGWAVDAWLKCDYLRHYVGQTLHGVVAGVTEFGVFVELQGFYIQGLLHISGLGSDYFHHHAHLGALIGERSGRRFALGDELMVRVEGVEPALGRIDLTLPSNSQGKASKQKQKRSAKNHKTADKRKKDKRRG